MSTSAQSRHAGILEFIAKAALLGGPLFYVLGRVYSEGYWNALGVSPSVMEGEAEDYIYLGFMVIASGLATLIPHWDAVPAWMAALVSMLLIGVLAVFVWLFGRVKIWLLVRLRRVARRLRRWQFKKKRIREVFGALGVASSILSAACSILLAVLVLSMALLSPIVIANSVGQEGAKKVADQLRTGARTGRFAQVEVDGVQIGRLVGCSEKYCVIYAHLKFQPVPIQSVRWLGSTVPSR